MENKRKAMLSSWDYSYEQTDLGYYDQGLYDAKDYMKSLAQELQKIQYEDTSDMITAKEYAKELRDGQYNNPFVTNPLSKNSKKNETNKKSFKKIARGIN